MKKLNNFKN